MAITITLLYPEGSDFNMDYYINKHMPMVADKFTSHGLIDYRVSALSGKDSAGGAWPYVCQCVLLFQSKEAWGKATSAPEGKEVFGDIPNFSKKGPTVWVGDVTANTTSKI